MASNLLKAPIFHYPSRCKHYTTLFSFHRKPPLSTLVKCSSTASPSPPSSREDAVRQAKLSLAGALRKPLNNSLPSLPTRKLRKQRQPRFRLEIPLVDDSGDSLTQLALDVFSDMCVAGKHSKLTLLILWPDKSFVDLANQVFSRVRSSESVVNSDLASVTMDKLSSADVAVLMAPELSQLEEIKGVAESLNPKPIVLFNPRWGFEEEEELSGAAAGLRSFAGSFDVVYSFMGLEVKGILSRRSGVIFRCVRDGVVSGGGEGWVVMVEDENGGGGGGGGGGGTGTEMKVVSRFKKRPTIGEVENLLYNYMAANSPVTKTVKYLKDLVSNVTGKKTKQ